MTVKAGSRLFGATSTTEMIVVRAPAGEIELTIGGHPALLDASGRDGSTDVAEGHGGGAAMGKRYVDEAGSIELLCTKAGDGLPALAGELLALKDAKPLPASD
ncbi:MAG: hypothetical protein Q7V88_01455 [Actinomycetota bacterium]|nr:hypothetical protein [Actinomycetota bacterium]